MAAANIGSAIRVLGGTRIVPPSGPPGSSGRDAVLSRSWTSYESTTAVLPSATSRQLSLAVQALPTPPQAADVNDPSGAGPEDAEYLQADLRAER
jgi:hypothetical protein